MPQAGDDDGGDREPRVRSRLIEHQSLQPRAGRPPHAVEDVGAQIVALDAGVVGARPRGGGLVDEQVAGVAEGSIMAGERERSLGSKS